jgi:ATP-dependent Lon protease
VGGIPEKIYGAKQAGMKKVIIPYDNQKDVPYGLKGIEVVAVKTIQEALTHIITEEVKQNIKVG